MVGRFIGSAPLWLKLLMLLPLLALAIFGAVSFAAGGWIILSISALAAAAVLWAWPGRYLGLFLAFGAWLILTTFLIVGVQQHAFWLVPFLALPTGLAIAWGTVRIGASWGWQRYRAMADRGRPMSEWEWVNTGANFAQNHPLYDRFGAVSLVIAFVLIFGGWQIWNVAAIWFVSASVWTSGLFGVILMVLFTVLIIALAVCWVLVLLLLIARHPLAWHLTWIPLVLGLPWSLPLIWYWADGVRPNLIYRHRFERLVRLPNASEKEIFR